MGPEELCCRCCFSLAAAVCSAVLIPLLFFNARKPACSIVRFYVPALDKSANSTSSNDTIFFDLKLHNRNRLKGVYYDPLNLTFSRAPNTSNGPLAVYTARGFYQGYGKTAHRSDAAVMLGSSPWEAAGNDSTAVVVFRVGLATAVRFKTILWKTKKRKMVVSADVEVGTATGEKARELAVILSASPAIGLSRLQWLGFPVAFFSAFI